MPCDEDKKYERIRAKDVGRPGHHYIKVGVRKGKGKRGGKTEQIGDLREYKHKTVHVKGHYRNGKYIKPHTRKKHR